MCPLATGSFLSCARFSLGRNVISRGDVKQVLNKYWTLSVSALQTDDTYLGHVPRALCPFRDVRDVRDLVPVPYRASKLSPVAASSPLPYDTPLGPVRLRCCCCCFRNCTRCFPKRFRCRLDMYISSMLRKWCTPHAHTAFSYSTRKRTLTKDNRKWSKKGTLSIQSHCSFKFCSSPVPTETQLSMNKHFTSRQTHTSTDTLSHIILSSFTPLHIRSPTSPGSIFNSLPEEAQAQTQAAILDFSVQHLRECLTIHVPFSSERTFITGKTHRTYHCYGTIHILHTAQKREKGVFTIFIAN